MPLEPVPLDEYLAVPELRNGCVILRNGHDSCASLLDIFSQFRAGRPGATTDEQQDLLRAMLLFAASCLDAVVKQLVLDSLPAVIERDDDAHDQFEVFVERRIKRTEAVPDQPVGTVSINSTFLAKVLASENPKSVLAEELVRSLRSDSLQSREQLLRVAAHFAITRDEIIEDFDEVEGIFRARNQITHEMDIDLSLPNRNRRPRRRDDMERAANVLLQIAYRFVGAVSARLA